MSKAKRPYRTLSEKEIREYLEGDNLTGEDRHKIERRALNSPFEQEALEGLEGLEGDVFSSDMRKLRKRISSRKNPGSFSWMNIAAVVAVLLVSTLAIWLAVDSVKAHDPVTMKSEEFEEKSADPFVEKEEVRSPEKAEDSMKSNYSSGATQAKPTKPGPEKEDPPPPVRKEELTQTEEPAEEEVLINEEYDLGDGEETERISVQPPAEITKEDKIADAYVETDDISGAGALSAPSKEGQLGLSQTGGRKKERQSQSKKATAAQRSTANPILLPEKSISGIVKSEDGEPLPGVNVIIKGTSKGTSTDINGRFTLDVPSNTPLLVVSYIGFETKEVQVGEETELVAVLDYDTHALSEIVMTDYSGQQQEVGAYQPATPTDGNKEFERYLEEHLVYPHLAKVNGIEGKVVLMVTVQADGEISTIEVKKGLGYGCDEEAIRLIREGPGWNPALRNGQGVEEKVRVRIPFSLND